MVRHLVIATVGLVIGAVVGLVVHDLVARPLVAEVSTITTGTAILLSLIWPACTLIGVVVALIVDARARSRRGGTGAVVS